MNQQNKKYFSVNVNKYSSKNFEVYRPASLNYPKNRSVMFIGSSYMDQAGVFNIVSDCLIFWPEEIEVPASIREKHAVVLCKEPRNSYCLFFRENNIVYLPPMEDCQIINGAYVAKTAIMGKNVQIFPGAYVGGEVEIGDNVYIGAGTKILGEVRIGNNVVIRENSVLGADGLSTDRDENGNAATMPQFGGVIVEDNVQIGANTVIARAAIDYTVLSRGSKIDNSTFISHNVFVGEDTFVVGETIMFGSSSTGKQAFISGNSTIREGRHIGNSAIVGMGAVVIKDVPDCAIVKGNPAR